MPFIVAPPVAPAPVVAVSTLGARAFDRLPHYVRAADDGTVAALLAAVGAPVQSLVELLIDPGAHGDPDRVPFARLGWLAAMAGVDLTVVPLAERRSFIASDASRYRGSPAAIRQRVGLTLTGARQVEIEFTSEYAVTVTTYASQTPEPTATEAAIRAEVPAWLGLTAVTDAAGQSYANLAADYATYGTMTATGKSYGTLSQEV